MAKVFVEHDPIEFPLGEPIDYDRVLRSIDRREEFLLTIERGRRNRARLKYQTRARHVIILARLELNGPRHRNPSGSPYRPGEWISGSHLHVYREGFEDRIAYELADAPNWNQLNPDDGIVMLEAFMRFCGIDVWPPIQVAL
jgi:hypothetical protein